jgi:hypothetical protein
MGIPIPGAFFSRLSRHGPGLVKVLVLFVRGMGEFGVVAGALL